MSQSCGGIDFLEEGTIKNSTIIGSQITDSRVSNSVLDAATITALASLDASSAETIADAIAQLPANQLAALAVALSAALAPKPGAFPVSSESDSIPTAIYGGRDGLLGKPDMMALSPDPSYVVPLYRV